jgi:hypothetical protein
MTTRKPPKIVYTPLSPTARKTLNRALNVLAPGAH